nr:sigma factor [Streptomyces venezuelae]
MTDSGVDLKPGGTDGLGEALAVFTKVRPRLFGIAYRMLSSATDAEDLVQEVWLRWQVCDHRAVLNPDAFPGDDDDPAGHQRTPVRAGAA